MLNQIVARKRLEIQSLLSINLADIPASSQRANYFKSEVTRDSSGRVRLIAEIKRASPFNGVLCTLEPDVLAKAYADAGADAISVLTDRHFNGHRDHLPLVKNFHLPVLRKDFIIDPLQIYESSRLGADAVLLIASILDYEQLLELVELTLRLGIEPLVEVHTREEVKSSLDTPARIIGINNRDLRNFKVNFNTSLELAPLIPTDRIKVSMSGITSPQDMDKLETAGFDAALIGETLVRTADISRKVRELLTYRGWV